LGVGWGVLLGVVGMKFLMGFSCGLAGSLLCILPVYLGALYAFLMKFSYLSKKIVAQVVKVKKVKFLGSNLTSTSKNFWAGPGH